MSKYVFGTLLSTYSPRHDGHTIALREIEIPAAESDNTMTDFELFEAAYKYGQNDFQPKEFCSVSVGDLITIMDTEAGTQVTRRVEGCGFGKDLSVRDVLLLKLQTRRDAWQRENGYFEEAKEALKNIKALAAQKES